MSNLANDLNAANKSGKDLNSTLGSTTASIAKLAVATGVIRGLASALQDAVQEMKNVDSELVNIQKVTGNTAAEMDILTDKAYEVGSALGVSASDYLASVTKWAQAGYGDLSDELGELSVKTQKVGDVQADTANQFLLSVDAAYQYKGNIEALTRVLDGANEISNRYATSVEKLAGGMGIVSSLAAQAGMDVEEVAAAIGTITAVTQESGNSAARALRALILNIQGNTTSAIDEETGERWDEEDIEATAAALQDLGVATTEYKNGLVSLRNPMEVIGEISERYRQGLISEIELQELVSSLGGKTRSNQLQALISNFDVYEEQVQTFVDGVGSAEAELEIYLDSWEAKAKQLQNTWTEFVAEFHTDDAIMGLLDLSNALLTFGTTDVGRITAVAGGMAALNAALQTFARTDTGKAAIATLAGLKTGFSGVGAAFKSGGLVTGVKSLGAAFATALGPIGLVITGIYAVTQALDWLTVTTDEHVQKAQEARAEYEDATSQIDSLNKQLEENNRQIAALNASGPLELTDQADIDRLKLENSLIEAQIILEERRREAAAREEFDQYRAALGGDFTIGSFTFGSDTTEKLEYNMASIERMQELIADLGDTAEDAQRKLEAEEAIEGFYENFNNEAEKFLNTYEAALNAGTQEARDWIADNQNMVDKITMFGREAEWAAGEIAELAASSRELGEALQAAMADGVVTEQEVENLVNLFPELQDKMDKSGTTASDVAEHLTALANRSEDAESALAGLNQELQDTRTEGEKLSDMLTGTVSKLELLTSAQDELNNSGTLSADTLAQLSENFEELAPLVEQRLAGIISEQELQDALTKQYQTTADEYKRTIVEKMLSNEEFYKNTVLTNTEIVSKLAELGITDLENYQTLEELKEEVNRRIQEEMTKNAKDGKNDREQIYGEEAATFAKLQGAMLASQKLVIDKMLPTEPKSLTDILNQQNGINPDELEYYDFGTGRQPNGSISQSALDSYWDEVMDILSSAIDLPSLSFDTPSSSSGTKSWYEEQIENLQNLVSETQDTNTLLEKEEADSYGKRIANLQAMQSRVHDMANQFRARGLSDTSDEVKQLKLMYHDLADEIEAVYQSMYDDLMEEHADRQWNLDLFEKNRENADRSVEEIAEDCQKIVSEYKSMQQEVADLAAYYRSMGYDETDDLIQDLSDAWWDYEDNIKSVYDALTNALDEYVSESDRQIQRLEQSTGTAGQRIQIYLDRITEAQKVLAQLQATNTNGINNDRINSVLDQIAQDEANVGSAQGELQDELYQAVDKIFEEKQEEIDHAQDKLDEANEAVAALDKELQKKVEELQDEIEKWQDELEDALDDPALDFFNDSLKNAGMSINEAIEKYTEAIEDERKSLEAATDPLRKQIEGYYTVNPDGTIGAYVPGLEDNRDYWQELLDAENERWEEEQKQHDYDLSLKRKELALQEAIDNKLQAQLDLEMAKNERTVYTLKDGVWAWRPDDKAIQDAEDALEDAEKAEEKAREELDWLRLEQAHDKLADFYEEQIELEEQKIEDLEKQIEALERESQARQDFFNDQLDMWEDEKEAWEEHYNDLIEKNNEEIKLLEDRYDFLKSQYDEEIEFWTTKVKELQSSYDAWAERWGDIQDSLTEDVRSLEEILADIAMYGAPELQAQIGNITDLLKDMGVSLGDFNSSIGDSGSGGNTGSGGNPYQNIIDQMRENGQKWWEAKNRGDIAEAEYYFKLNQQLGAQIPGITFNPGSGEWYWPDGTPLYDNGGLAVGKGIMVKDVEEPELVLSPEQTKKFFTMPVLAQDVLNQSTNDYDRYMQDMGVMYGTNRDLAPDTRMERNMVVNNVDSHNVGAIINGVELGENMLDRPLSEILSLLGIHRDY